MEANFQEVQGNVLATLYIILNLIILVQLLLSSIIFSFLHGFVKQVSSLGSSFVNGGINPGRVLLEERKQDLGVDDAGSVTLERRHAPDQEETLAKPVEWDPASQDIWERYLII